MNPLPTSLAALVEQMQQLGAAPIRHQRVLRRWLNGQPLDAGRQAAEHFLPAPLRAALPALKEQLAQIAQVQSVHPAPDGSERLLIALHDGQTVESVLLPRDGLCVSSQVGCAVGCGFCMTGVGGLQRQMGSAEIVAQVVLARARRPVKKVVFMGMGEPAHNLDAVLEAIEALGTLGGIGHKNLVFSSVGDERAFVRLAEHDRRVKPALALSLHTTDAAKRAELLPRAPLLDPQWLVEEADRYARTTGYPAQIQWTLLAGVNDGPDEVDALIPLLRGRKAMLNLIPYNTVPGLPWQRPAWEHAAAMARMLNAGGVLTRLRRSAGQEVEGGCGQLRARSQPVRVVRRAATST